MLEEWGITILQALKSEDEETLRYYSKQICNYKSVPT